MHSNSVVISGLFAVVLVLWIERRKKFKGPDIDLDALSASNVL